MAKKITISFKENSKEMKLYAAVDSLEDKSGWIKEIISKALIEEENKNKENRRDLTCYL